MSKHADEESRQPWSTMGLADLIAFPARLIACLASLMAALAELISGLRA
jgi:hypothetical protein